MITPLCGDGMAMALRTAQEIAVPMVSDYFTRSSAGAHDLKLNYRDDASGRSLNLRLQLGRLMHSTFIQPQIMAQVRGVLPLFCPIVPWWQLVEFKTPGSASLPFNPITHSLFDGLLVVVVSFLNVLMIIGRQ
jgi:hypothetical protein